mgnify:CR=1 FL=1
MAAKKIGISRDLIIHPEKRLQTSWKNVESHRVNCVECRRFSGLRKQCYCRKERDICKLCQRIRVCNRSTKVFLAESSGEL